MDQILKSNTINFNLLSTIPFLLFSYGIIDFSTRYVFKTTWNSKDVVAKVRESKRLLSELEQILILHLTPTHEHGRSIADGLSSRSRYSSHALHSVVHTLSIDQFAALGSQEQEDEDDALRRQASPSATARDPSHIGTEIFGNLEQAADGVEPVSDHEEEQDSDISRIVGRYEAAASSGRQSLARNLFPSASVSTPPAPVPHASHHHHSVLQLNNHAYGHTLLLIHELSMRLASLPLHASVFSRRGMSGMHDARLSLHKDLILLASDSLSPDQKLRWLRHMREAYAFLAPNQQ
jgi:hypothetical protein